MKYNYLKTLSLIIASLLFLQSCSEERKRLPTAMDNVTIIAQQFNMPGLDRSRTLRIYLPPDYKTSQNKYPVLYMHDGQNLFDDATSYAGEWGVDEILNNLHSKDLLSLIVVGVDNGGDKRMNELSPWENSRFGVAEGKHYMDFVVQVVKPYIDQNFRTLSDQQNTAIMGSSMGGLISHYAIFEHSDVFSKAGIFSPSFWYSEKVYPFSKVTDLNSNARLYFMIGSEEGDDAVDDMQRLVGQLKSEGLPEQRIKSTVVTGGEHNEGFWRAQFEQAILWLFAPLPSSQN